MSHTTRLSFCAHYLCILCAVTNQPLSTSIFDKSCSTKLFLPLCAEANAFYHTLFVVIGDKIL